MTALPAPARIQFAKSKHPSPEPLRFRAVLCRFVPRVAWLPCSWCSLLFLLESFIPCNRFLICFPSYLAKCQYSSN